jgi:hypothetical protein
LLEDFLVDARLVIQPFTIGRRQQLAQIAIADAVLHQQYQMVVARAFDVVGLGREVAFRAFAGCQVGFATDNRFDPAIDRLLVKLDRAEHVAMVGDGHRRHPALLGVVEQRHQLVGAVEQTVLGMDV